MVLVYSKPLSRKDHKENLWIVTAIFSATAVLTLPAGECFQLFFIPVFASMIFLIGYGMLRNIKGMISGRTADYIYFFVFLMLSLGATHDMFVALGGHQFHRAMFLPLCLSPL